MTQTETKSATAGLSALLIARDEEADLPGCLESLRGLASEIIVVVDDATTDGTEALARAAGCKVSCRRFDNYAGQRQAALDLCTKEWVLWIDCDERAPRRLEFPKDAAACELPFKILFLGRELRWGGMGVETHVRLFRREKARFTGGTVHETLEIAGQTVFQDAPILHEPYRDLSDYLGKLDRYTTLAARKARETGRRFRFWHHFLVPAELFRRLVLRLGFLDGFPGVAWATLAAFHHWLKYAKLKEMEDRAC